MLISLFLPKAPILVSMKTIILLIIFVAALHVPLSAQQTVLARAPHCAGIPSYKILFAAAPSAESYSRGTDLLVCVTRDRKVMQAYAKRPLMLSQEKIRKLRTTSIVLAAVGGGLHLLGFSMNAAASHTYNYPARNAMYGTGGIANIVGLAVGLADVGTWIAYACALKKYKHQHDTVK